jgi:hypothetical protein
MSASGMSANMVLLPQISDAASSATMSGTVRNDFLIALPTKRSLSS